MNQSTTRLELALQSALLHCMDDVVRDANADAARLEGASKCEKLEKNQIRNVLNVAEESHSLAVVTNFIRYQMGRSGTGPAWRHNGFGLRVVEQIESLMGVVHRRAEQGLAELPDLPEGAREQVRYELMRYYLGYLNRAFVYGNSGLKDAWENLRQASQEA